MRNTQKTFRNSNKSRWNMATDIARPRMNPVKILKIFSSVFIAATGIAAPEDAMAKTRLAEDERTEISAPEEIHRATAGNSGMMLATSQLKASPFMPGDAGKYSIINKDSSVVLSGSENTESNWDKFAGLIVGDTTSGFLLIDGRQINTDTGTIGNRADGSITLTNGANWIINNGNLVLGTNNGNGSLLVEKGSAISGIDNLRIGEFYAGSMANATIDGEKSEVKTRWAVVGDQGIGILNITNGGKLSTTEHMNIGYVGVTANTARNGNGSVLVSGDGSELNVATNLYLGGFKADINDAKAALTVDNGGKVSAGSFIWLGVGIGSTGILNIGAAQGEEAREAGIVDTPRIHLGDTAAHENTAILNFNHLSDDFSLSANITGRGEVLHNGPGTTLLSGQNSWIGKAVLNNGTIRAGSTGALSPYADFIVEKGALLDLNGYHQTINSLVLKGVVNYGDTASGQHTSSLSQNVLTIKGNYHSDGGSLILNTAKNTSSDQSQVNRLHIKGNSSGTTYVFLDNLGDINTDNLNGSQVVQVDGISDGEFLAGTRLVAGAYEYSINRGEAAKDSDETSVSDANHWYLINGALTPNTPPGTISPDNGVVYRPEAGAYLANRVAGNMLFNTRLYDRLGDTQYIDPLTGEKRVTSLWLRNIGGHTRFQDASGQMKTQANRYVLQLGGDLATWSNGLSSRLHLGAMGGYANSQSNTRSAITGYQADGSVSGYSTGLYATWYANDDEKQGTYLDSWILYNWFDNSVKGQQLAAENYHSSGITASAEAGVAFKMGESERVSYWLQPQMQLTWMGVTADDHRESNGTWVKDSEKGNLQSRLGVKTWLRGHSKLDDGKPRLFQPFVEANWLHNTNNAAISMNNTTVQIKGTKDIAELRTGVEAKVNERLHIWGNIGQQIGSEGYSDTQGVLGFKVLF